MVPFAFMIARDLDKGRARALPQVGREFQTGGNITGHLGLIRNTGDGSVTGLPDSGTERRLRARLSENLGMMIPSENEPAKEYGIAVAALKMALSVLVQEGVLLRRQRKGTFVASPDFSKSFSRFFRHDRKSGNAVVTPGSKFLSIKSRLYHLDRRTFACDDYFEKTEHFESAGGAVVPGSFQAFDQTCLIAALDRIWCWLPRRMATTMPAKVFYQNAVNFYRPAYPHPAI